jgi:hypothetical protein
MKCCELAMEMKVQTVALYLIALNDLNISVRIVRMIHEAGALQPL